MQEMHRSACAVFGRVSCMKCQTTKTTPNQTTKTTKQQTTKEESGRLLSVMQGETGVRHKSGVELAQKGYMKSLDADAIPGLVNRPGRVDHIMSERSR